jgi:hypothetical protein
MLIKVAIPCSAIQVLLASKSRDMDATFIELGHRMRQMARTIATAFAPDLGLKSDAQQEASRSAAQLVRY